MAREESCSTDQTRRDCNNKQQKDPLAAQSLTLLPSKVDFEMTVELLPVVTIAPPLLSA